ARIIAAQPSNQRSDRAIGRLLGIHNKTVKTIRDGTITRINDATLKKLEAHAPPIPPRSTMGILEQDYAYRASERSDIEVGYRALVDNIVRVLETPDPDPVEFAAVWKQFQRLMPKPPEDFPNKKPEAQRFVWKLLKVLLGDRYFDYLEEHIARSRELTRGSD